MAELSQEQAFLAAAEIAGKVPKHLQEIAFNRALDHLFGSNRGGPDALEQRAAGRKPRATSTAVTELVSMVERTKYPDVGATSRVADRALKVLQLANDDLGVDGLTASEISEILTKRFRLPVTQNAVNIALERETTTVDVRVVAGVKRFHIMAPGEEYLKKLRSGDTLSRGRRQKTRAPSNSAKEEAKAETRSGERPRGKEKKRASASVKGKRSTARPGPKAAVTQLISREFFNDPHTLSQVQKELRHHGGHTYSVQELAPALVRSVRDGSLHRKRDAQGQYEYSDE